MSMETAVSLSSISELRNYRRTRFPLALFGPLALLLALAAAAVDPTATIKVWLWHSLLVLPWLLQFRLADDLADLPRDRRDHPDRVLVRSPPGRFVALLVLLVAGNTLLTAWLCPPLRWAEFLALSGVFLIWYAVTRPFRPPLLLAGLVVLLKYPAFVYLLVDARMDVNGWALTGVLVLVYACFVTYECWHDERFHKRPRGWENRG
jgi:hypothetical protein